MGIRTVQCPHCGLVQAMKKLVDHGTHWVKTCVECGKDFVVSKESTE